MDLRERTFREYMNEKSLLKEEYIFCHRGFSVDNGYHLMKDAIEQLGNRLPTAFFIAADPIAVGCLQALDRKSTRLNSSHVKISYAVFCLKKNKIMVQKNYNWQFFIQSIL